MKWLFISGAPWGATAGGQRYEQLVKALQLLGEDAFFFCPYSQYPPSPFAPKELSYDVLVIGFPHPLCLSLPFSASLTIYDVCDFWEGDMGINADVSLVHRTLCKKVDALVATSSTLAFYLHANYPTKPLAVIPNALRIDFPVVKAQRGIEPVVAFWGSWYTGQNWWDFQAIAYAAEKLSHLKFLIFGASDRPFPAQLPLNVHVETTWWGVSIQHIVSQIQPPFVGIVPYCKANKVCLCADPIKNYEYLKLNGVVVATNCCPMFTPVSHVILLFGETKELLPTAIEKAVELACTAGKPPVVPTFVDRAQQYINFVRQLR